MKAMNLISLMVLLTLGCQGSTSVNSSPIPLTSELNNQETPITNAMRPKNPVSFIPGLPIKPSSQLLNWLNNEASTTSETRKRLRLPVVIHFEDSYRLALGDSFIGTSDKDRDNDAIFLTLDDTGMGVSLLSTLNDICPKTTNSCAVWLEGYWGSLVDLDLPELSELEEDEEDKWPFAVLKVHELIQEQPEQDEEIRVFIEVAQSRYSCKIL